MHALGCIEEKLTDCSIKHFSRRYFLGIAIAIAIVVACCGCASAPPPSTVLAKTKHLPPQPTTEFSTIRIQSRYEKGVGIALWGFMPVRNKLHDHRTWVQEIDGRSVLGMDETRVSPGQHAVGLTYYRDSVPDLCGMFSCVRDDPVKKTNLVIDFHAEANHVYRFFAYAAQKRDWIWVVDETVGQVVSGEKPVGFD